MTARPTTQRMKAPHTTGSHTHPPPQPSSP
jgi:hypothetical protein